MKLAIVHDFLNQYGGAERVVETFNEIFPDVPIYTSIYIPENMPNSFRKMDIRTSFMQKLPFLDKHFKKYLLLYPKAFESFDLYDYDIILSSCSSFAKGIRKPKRTLHICYCYNPMRFVWNYMSYIEKEDYNVIIQKVLPIFIKKLKKWDVKTNFSVNYFIAISRAVQERIEKFYNRESIVIYPPVNTEKSIVCKRLDDYFLVVSRLNAYKRIDLVVEAFNRMCLPLKIIGDGPYKNTLKKMSRDNIEFLGKVSERDLIYYYSKCRAVIFPGEEDFGIVPVEAQSCGRPVIAYASGGALETVIDGVTGQFFKQQNVKTLIDCIKKFINIEKRFDINRIRNNANKFNKAIFKRKMLEFISEKYNNHLEKINYNII